MKLSPNGFLLIAEFEGLRLSPYYATAEEKAKGIVTIGYGSTFYPASKALKSIFVLSDEDYPPKWIMKKVYNFEEDGDLGDLFKTTKNEGENFFKQNE